MSMTDLKALGERAVRGARKLPAAPALWRGGLVMGWLCGEGGGGMVDVHHVVDAAEVMDAALDGLLEAFDLADVDVAEAEDFGAGACGRDRGGHGFGFGDVAADDAGVGAEVDEGPHLG